MLDSVARSGYNYPHRTTGHNVKELEEKVYTFQKSRLNNPTLSQGNIEKHQRKDYTK
jgi:hypothetical protein